LRRVQLRRLVFLIPAAALVFYPLNPILKGREVGGNMSGSGYISEASMPQNYVPIFIFIAFIGVLIPVTLLAAKLVRPDNPSKTKLMPYECGIDPVDSSRGRYTVRYYIVAILFVVFDVETIFLFPWAVQFKALGAFGLLEMLIFLLILVVGYIWIWKKGALEWV
jgi:NADH-quinone oxidoreductase subunit A